MGNLFKRGYEASRAEKQRQDEARENAGKRLWKFFLTDDGDEADLRFLTEEPVNFYEHNIKSTRNGKDSYQQYTCTGENCPYCADGDRATFKGAYLVVDHREFEYKDEKGKKKKGRDQVRLFIQGMKVVSQLDRISNKYGLSNRDVTVIRLGTGTQTNYTVEKGDEEKLSSKQIENLLPEKLRDDYDGTVDSLYDIIEEQLLMNAPDYDSSKEDDDDDSDDDEDDGRGIIGAGDDDDEDDTPRSKKLSSSKSKTLSSSGSKSLKKSTSSSTSGKKNLFKKPQNSVKPRAKMLLKK